MDVFTSLTFLFCFDPFPHRLSCCPTSLSYEIFVCASFRYIPDLFQTIILYEPPFVDWTKFLDNYRVGLMVALGRPTLLTSGGWETGRS